MGGVEMKIGRRTFMSLFGATLIAWGLDPAVIYEEIPDHIFSVIPNSPTDAQTAKLLEEMLHYLLGRHIDNVYVALSTSMTYNPEPIAWESEPITLEEAT